MKKLVITNEMSTNERKARMLINHTMDYIKEKNEFKNWLIDQTTGVIKDGMVITYPWLSYEAVLNYYKEATI